MSDQQPSEFNQSSFIGGMNLLGDDSRLQPNQYRIGFNLTNRYDELDAILQSVEDTAAPLGKKQAIVTFGNYIILFVQGTAWYRFYLDTGWTQITGFAMSPSAPRYWTIAVPVATTNYVRLANTQKVGTAGSVSSPNTGINLANVQGASLGNLPGLLVQDNINQPQFIFLDSNGFPVVRTTQSFEKWYIAYTTVDNTVISVINGILQDMREYVPVGNTMAFDDGILYIASQDGSYIYRSVSGRPLDFVVNVTNLPALNTGVVSKTYTNPFTGQQIPFNYPPFSQSGGGDATTTSYSVGVGGITTLRQMSSGGIFVSASGANFVVTKNMTQNAPTTFGEYTFIRTALFNANCLSDRAIFDSLGDTRFIDLTGVRSFNAIEQVQNEGRNSVFTSQIQAALTGITQDAFLSAGILYDNYELYGLNTIFGPAIAKYDTVNGCWSSFDINQTGGKLIKIFAKIELSVQRLYAVSEDDKLYTLYIGPKPATAQVRTVGVCANILYANQNIKMNNPSTEVKLQEFRFVLNNITADLSLSFSPFVNNRLVGKVPLTKTIKYFSPVNIYTSSSNLPDVNTQLTNGMWSIPNCAQGWKVFGLFSWDNGTVTQYSMKLDTLTPMNPLRAQAVSPAT